MKLDAAKTIVAIITGVIVVIGAVWAVVVTVDKYFAKQADVSEIRWEAKIDRAEADVRYQEQSVDRVRDRIQFQHRIEPPAGAEKQALDQDLAEEEKRLEELEEARKERQKQYEQKAQSR